MPAPPLPSYRVSDDFAFTKIDDYGKDGGLHFTECMIGICPLATHSYQNLQLQHKILTTATIDLGFENSEIFVILGVHVRGSLP